MEVKQYFHLLGQALDVVVHPSEDDDERHQADEDGPQRRYDCEDVIHRTWEDPK